MLAVRIGYCTFESLAKRLGIPFNNFCRSLQNEKLKETIIQFLGNCTAYDNLSLKCLNKRHSSSFAEPLTIYLKFWLSFIRIPSSLLLHKRMSCLFTLQTSIYLLFILFGLNTGLIFLLL